MQEHAAPGGSKLAPRFLIAGLASQGDQSGGHGRRLGYPPNPLHYTDHQDHQQVWRALHLTALNTWIRPQHGQVATFMFEGTEHQPQSQIDFVIIRSHHCATRSKQAGIIESFPGAAWRSGANIFRYVLRYHCLGHSGRTGQLQRNRFRLIRNVSFRTFAAQSLLPFAGVTG